MNLHRCLYLKSKMDRQDDTRRWAFAVQAEGLK